MEKGRTFSSKILLFGEYSIIQHSMGLAVPYELFYGQLMFRKVSQASPRVQTSNREIKSFANHLSELESRGEALTHFDLTSLEFDLAQGLFFESTIPQGFGVGSSGALTASLYDRYAREKVEVNGMPSPEKVNQLKRIFAQMEAHFHGSSSGFDPLICYLNRPLLIRGKGQIEVTAIPEFPKQGTGAIFLLDTARPRRTEPLVHLFLEKCKNEAFKSLCKNQLAAYNDSCITHVLNADIKRLAKDIKKLSAFQQEHFKPMIPPLFRKLWDEGLQTGDYTLKLCGAGGGGFLLGFTENFDRAKQLLQGHQIRGVYRF